MEYHDTDKKCKVNGNSGGSSSDDDDSRIRGSS